MNNMERGFVIWSEEHGAWWRGGKNGYTRSLVQAGLYPESMAREIVENANKHLPPKEFREVMFLMLDWNKLDKQQSTTYIN